MQAPDYASDELIDRSGVLVTALQGLECRVLESRWRADL